jgi:hypothetical protein
MGPHRIIHNRRGYLTETFFDTQSGRFRERPFPPLSDAGASPLSTAKPPIAVPEGDQNRGISELDSDAKTCFDARSGMTSGDSDREDRGT